MRSITSILIRNLYERMYNCIGHLIDNVDVHIAFESGTPHDTAGAPF